MSPGLVTISAWIAFAGAGVVITAFNLRDAWRDSRYLQQADVANGRAIIAKAGIVNESLRLLALVLLLIAGVLVASVQFAPHPPPASLYVRSVILLTIIILVSNTIVQRWVRHRLSRPN